MNRVGGEALGTALLLYVIVGSGVAVERLGGDAAAGLFVHGAVVGAALAVLVALLITVTGAHFNPAVTLALWRAGLAERSEVGPYIVAQIVGAAVGVVAAHLTFEDAWVTVATVERSGVGRPMAEVIGTFVLVGLIIVLVRTGRRSAVPSAVGAWVTTIIVATSSAGFANPAVTIARTLTDTYTGIAPVWVPGFVIAQLLGAYLAVVVANQLVPHPRSVYESG